MYKKTAVHTRFILITTLKRIHCCKSRFRFRDKGPRNNIPSSTFSPKKQQRCNLDRYSFVYVSSLQGELLFVSVMEQIMLKNSVLVVKKTAWFCSRQCPKQNEIIQKKKSQRYTEDWGGGVVVIGSASHLCHVTCSVFSPCWQWTRPTLSLIGLPKPVSYFLYDREKN